MRKTGHGLRGYTKRLPTRRYGTVDVRQENRRAFAHLCVISVGKGSWGLLKSLAARQTAAPIFRALDGCKKTICVSVKDCNNTPSIFAVHMIGDCFCAMHNRTSFFVRQSITKKFRQQGDDQMPREHPDYRNNLERLNELIPDRELLTPADVMKITGYKSIDTVKKYFPFTNRRISKAAVARIMCGN